MARPVTREVKLKTGFYIEVRRRGENRGIKIWHESPNQMNMAMRRYEPMYDVHIIGEVKNGKILSKLKKKVAKQ